MHVLGAFGWHAPPSKSRRETAPRRCAISPRCPTPKRRRCEIVASSPFSRITERASATRALPRRALLSLRPPRADRIAGHVKGPGNPGCGEKRDGSPHRVTKGGDQGQPGGDVERCHHESAEKPPAEAIDARTELCLGGANFEPPHAK